MSVLDNILNKNKPAQSAVEEPSGFFDATGEPDISYYSGRPPVAPGRKGLALLAGGPGAILGQVKEQADEFFGVPPAPGKQFRTRLPGEPEVGPLALSEDEETFLKFQEMAQGETEGLLDKGLGTVAVTGGQIARVASRMAYIGTQVSSDVVSRVLYPEGVIPEDEQEGFASDAQKVLVEEGAGLLNMMGDALPQLLLSGPDFTAQALGGGATSPGRAMSDVDQFMDGPIFQSYSFLHNKLTGETPTREEWKQKLIDKSAEVYQAPEIPFFGLHMAKSVGKTAVRLGKRPAEFLRNEARTAQDIAADPHRTGENLVSQLERADALRRVIQKEQVLRGQEEALGGLSPQSNAAARRVLGPELESPAQGRAQAEGGRPLRELKTAEERVAGTLAEKPSVVKALDQLTGQKGSPKKSAKRSAKVFKTKEAPESVKPAAKAQPLKKGPKPTEKKAEVAKPALEPKTVAKDLGIKFNGMQDRPKKEPVALFTDPKTGTTFPIEDLSKAKGELALRRKKFEEKAPKKKPTPKAKKAPVGQEKAVFTINQRNKQIAEAVAEGFKSSGLKGDIAPIFEKHPSRKGGVDPTGFRTRTGTITPQWWTNKGFQPKEMVVIATKVLDGKPITARQRGEFKRAAKDWMAARRAETLGKRTKGTGELIDKSGSKAQQEYLDGIAKGEYLFVPAALSAAGALSGDINDQFAVAGLLAFFGGGKRKKKVDTSTAMGISELSLRPKQIVTSETIPPKAKTLPAFDTPDVKRVGLSKVETERTRSEYGLDKLPESERQSFTGWMEQAKAQGYDQNALSIARSFTQVKKGTFSNYEGLSVTEQMGLGLKKAELLEQYDRTAKKVEEFQERGDLRSAERNRPALEQFLEEVDLIDRALIRGRREVARALGVGRAVISRETMDLSSVVSRGRLAKQGRLTKEETANLSELSKTARAQEEVLKTAQAKWDADAEVREKARADAIVKAQKKLATETKQQSKAKAKEVKSRDDIKARLNELGFRANEITGLPVEVALLVGKLAFSHIKDGARTLDQVVKRTISDIPDLTPRDVRQAILAKDPKVQKKARSEASKAKSHILRQATILDKIEKAKQGIFDAPQSKPPVPADIKALMKLYKQLRDQAHETITDPHRLQRAVHSITLLREQLDGQYRLLKKKQRPTPAEIKTFQTEASGLRKQMRLEDTLADLNEQLRTGEFKIPEKKIAPEVPVHIQRLQADVGIARRNVKMGIEELAPWTFGRRVREGTGFLRTLKATADMSAVGRQAFLLTAMRPGVAVTSFGKAAKAMFSEHSAEIYDQGIRNSPHHYIREGARLYLSEVGGKLGVKEEHFASSWADKIPVWGKVIKGSERHMTTFLNQMRVAAFDQFLAKHPNATMPELTAWADFINKASGRGDFGKYAGAGELLSLGLFAPKFALSRIQAPLAIVGKKQRGLPRVQKEIAKELVATTALGTTALTFAHYAGLDVGLDPDEADWGKIRFGDTRIDIFAGIQQPTRAAYRVMRSALDATGATDNVLRRDEDPIKIIEQFAEFKFAPVVSATRSLITGKTAVGEKIEPWEVLARSPIPITFESIIDAVKDEGIGGLKDPETFAGPALDFFGVGANRYKDTESRIRRDINNAIVDGDSPKAYAKTKKLVFADFYTDW